MKLRRSLNSLLASAMLGITAAASAQQVDPRFAQLDSFLRGGVVAEAHRVMSELERDYAAGQNPAMFLELVCRRPLVRLMDGDKEGAISAYEAAATYAVRLNSRIRAVQMRLARAELHLSVRQDKTDADKEADAAFDLLVEERNLNHIGLASQVIGIHRKTGTLKAFADKAEKMSRSTRVRWDDAIIIVSSRIACEVLLGEARSASRAAQELKTLVRSTDPVKSSEVVGRFLSDFSGSIDPAKPEGAAQAKALFETAKVWGNTYLLFDSFYVAHAASVRTDLNEADAELTQTSALLKELGAAAALTRLQATAALQTAAALNGTGATVSRDALINRLNDFQRNRDFEASSDELAKGRGWLAETEYLLAIKAVDASKAAKALQQAALALGKAGTSDDIKGLRGAFLRLPPAQRQIGILLNPLRRIGNQLASGNNMEDLDAWYAFWFEVAENVDFQSSVILYEDALASLKELGETGLPIGQRPRTPKASRARAKIAALLAKAASVANKNGQSAYVLRYFLDMKRLGVIEDRPESYLEVGREVFFAGFDLGIQEGANLVGAASQSPRPADLGWSLAIFGDSCLSEAAATLERNPDQAQRQLLEAQTYVGRGLTALAAARKKLTDAGDSDGLAWLDMMLADQGLRNLERDDIRAAFAASATATDEEKQLAAELSQPDLDKVLARLAAARQSAKSPSVKTAVECRAAAIECHEFNYEAAEKRLTEVVKDLSPEKDRVMWLSAMEILGRAQHEQRKHESTWATLSAVVNEVEKMRTDAQALESVKRSFQVRYRDSYLRAVDAALNLGRLDDAFVMLQKTKSRTLLDGIKDKPNLLPQGVIAEKGGEESDILQGLSDSTYDYLFASTPVDGRGVDVRAAEGLADKLEELERRLEGLNALLNAQNPSMARQRTSPVANLAQAKAGLAADDALIEFADLSGESPIVLPGRRAKFLPWTTGGKFKRAFAFVVRPNADPKVVDFELKRSGGGAAQIALKDEANAFSLLLSKAPKPEELEANLTSTWESGFNLSKRIMEPLAPAISGAKRLLIAPQGFFWKVPFQLLPEDAQGTKVAWDTYNVNYIPSMSCQIQLADRGRDLGEQTYSGTVLCLADPFFGRFESIDKKEDSKETPDLERSGAEMRPLWKRLWWTKEEAKAVKSRVSNGQVVYEDKEATELNLRNQISRFRVLHVASHAVFVPDAPMQSTLALADPNMMDKNLKPNNDGLLTAREIQELDLRCYAVVLSACETGKVLGSGPEDTMGLLWSFFVGGANLQVVSSWEVSDEATADLMEVFYNNLYPSGGPNGTPKPSLSFCESLRQAAFGVRSQGAKEEHKVWRHPYYWGAFYSIGLDATISKRG